MATEFYGFEDDEPRVQGKDNLFLWTVFILLLIGLALFSWLGSFYIFAHPEQPRSYDILMKLKKLEPPKRFEVTAAPEGEFLTPKMLFDRYSKYAPLQLADVNAELMRNYIKNYKEAKGKVPYVSGRFEIVDTYVLKQNDLFPTGVVAVAVANEFSQVVIEHVFTTAEESVETLQQNLPNGLDMRLEKTRDPVSIIHVEWTDDGRLMFTAMPLLYGTWGVKGSIGSFSLEPPPSLNLRKGAPIVRGDIFAQMMARFAATRRSKLPVETGEGTVARAEPELVRVDASKPGVAVPATGAIPPLPMATPIPLAANTSTVRNPPAVRGTPAAPLPTPYHVAMNATPTPFPVAPPPAVIPGVPPPVVTPRLSPTGVPLKPFVVESSPLAMGGNVAWRTFSRGKQPPGRSVTPVEASRMADQGGMVAERLYLRGDFVVTAAGDNRAILRAPPAPGEPSKGGVSLTRILVEFPPSVELPAVGSTLSRDEAAGFEVREVKRGKEGEVNIFVRDITLE